LPVILRGEILYFVDQNFAAAGRHLQLGTPRTAFWRAIESVGNGAAQQVTNFLRFRPVMSQDAVQQDDLGGPSVSALPCASYELFAEATNKPRTRADMVATRPIFSLTTSFESALR
jgi:hypothetical protein